MSTSANTNANKAPVEWAELVNDATRLFARLRAAQAKCPEKSMQRVETGKLAHALDAWCQFVEENMP